MGLGCKIQDCAGLVFGEQCSDARAITDIALNKNVTLVVGERGEVIQIACVGELIQVDDWFVVLREPGVNKVTADKAGAASDKNHALSSRKRIDLRI
jgi:hypothetical protein